MIGFGFFLSALAFGSTASLLWAILAGTPLGLRLCGLALVTRSGQPASRFRVVGRTLIATLPLAGIAIPWFQFVLTGKPTAFQVLTISTLLLLLATSLIHALCRPTRALPDVLAGTAIVPR